MKNKKLIFRLLISFVMVFAVAFGFGLKTDMQTAEATEAKSVRVYDMSNTNSNYTGFVIDTQADLESISTLMTRIHGTFEKFTSTNTCFSIKGTVYEGSSSDVLDLPAGETAVYLYLSNSTYDITIKDENGTTATDSQGLSVSPLSTVSELRTYLKTAYKTNVLKLNDVVLEDSKTLASYGFKNGDTITVVVPHIDFTPTAVYTGNYGTNNDTLLLSGTETNLQVSVQYKVVANTGINNLVLVPSYDKAVFSIASVSVNEAALGEATVTGTYGSPDVIKVALESPTTYSGTDTNTVLMTVVFNVNAAAATDENYTFGLALPEANETLANYNNSSKANVFATGEQLGGQDPVEIRIVLNSTTPENVVKILKKRTAEIEIGYEYEDEYANKYYDFVYGTEFSVTGPEALGDQPETNPTAIKYSYHEKNQAAQLANGTFTITWYEANLEGNKYVKGDELNDDELDDDGQPTYVGTYMVGIQAEQNGVYLPVAEQLRVVKIDKLTIVVTIENKTSVYLDPIVALTANYTADQLSAWGYCLKTTAQDGSYVGSYNIYLDYLNNASDVDPNFAIDLEHQTYGTYTITALQLVVTALPQQATYSGSEPTVDQTKYTIVYKSNPENSWSGAAFGVTLTKDPSGYNVGSYSIVPQVVTNENYTSEKLANFSFEYVNGAFTITSASGTNVVQYFTGRTVQYNGEQQNLITVDTDAMEANAAWLLNTYTFSNNLQTNVLTSNEGWYVITVTITLDSTTANNQGLETTTVFNVNGKITPAPITIKADDKGHTYGSNPVPVTDFTYTVTSGTRFGSDNLNATYSTTPTMTSTTNAGEYPITLTATNSNYNITCVNGTYTVSKAQASITSVLANNIYYNRPLDYQVNGVSIPGIANPVEGTDYTITVTLDTNEEHGQTVNNVRPYGTYTITATVAGTNNYDGATKSTTFHINKIALATPTVTYPAYNTARWAPITKDCEGENLVTGTEVINNLFTDSDENYYYFTLSNSYSYGTPTLYHHSNNNDNYTSSSVILKSVVTINFVDDPDEHPKNTSTPTNMPDPIITFNGKNVPDYPMPTSEPTLPGYDFGEWDEDLDEDGHPIYVASWTIKTFKVTLKFTEDSNTLDTDKFEIQAEYKGTIQFTLSSAPTKAGTPGISYNYNGKVAYNSAEYTAAYANGTLTVTGYELTGNGVVFVAQYNAVNKLFDIYYYVKTTPDAQDYTLYQTVENVAYNSDITYLANPIQARQWFKVNPWALENGNAAPAKMPAEDLEVYSEVVFDIGQGDVNGNKAVTTDDITLYRQMIVGGYEMTVVAAGNEWNAAENYKENTRYFLVGVADNNGDTSKDIRDVSVTRMALVGGYTWVIEHGVRVSGDDIVRSTRVTSAADLKTALTTTNKKVSIIADINDAEDFVVSPAKDMYLDLCGHTLTVKSFVVSTNSNVTVTILNGTIVTTNGITISAPNGNVVLTDLVGYVNNNPVNLAAASNSLHINGLVKFINGTTASETPATVQVEKGTHVVIEHAAEIVVEKLVVTQNNFTQEATGTGATISIDNHSFLTNEIIVKDNKAEITSHSDTINNLAELKAFRDAVNAGNNFAGKTVELNADITLDEAWTPISNYSRRDTDNESKWFAGTFDGNNHTISGLMAAGSVNMYLNKTDEYTYGLFGSVKNAVIKDLTLANVNIELANGDTLGALVGYYSSSETKTNISNVSVTGSVSGADNVAGLVGRASGTYFKAVNITVSGTVTATYKAAGIVGTGNANEMVFENCTNNADVSSTVVHSTNAGYNAVAGISITWKDACQKVVMTGCVNEGEVTTVNPNAIHGKLAVDYSPQTQLNANGTWTYESNRWIYTISTLAELETFRNEVNAGNDFAGKKVKLTDNITLTSGWTPIGEGSRKLGDVALVGYPTYFRGEFDGNKHTISGLTNAGFTPTQGRIVSGQYAYGLFALVGDGAYLHDLTLAEVAIDTTVYDNTIKAIGDSVGALVGYSIGNITVDHITVSGTVKASESVGGIIGRSICDVLSVAGAQTVRVTNCTNNANVIGYGSDNNAVKASGIVGYTAIYVNTTGSIVLTNNTNNGAVSVTNTCTGNNTYKAIAAGIACYGQGTANSATGSVTITENTNTASVSGSAAVVMTDPIAQLCWTSFKSENTTIENNTNTYSAN